ncbi:MAG: NADP-dependent malic enzyme, partial [Patescibacteria group bacterium]|nr:NADP-dependent malic enzyme [Patescibacteria group bacterium]
MDKDQQAIELHKKNQGKLETVSKITIKNKEDLALAYTPHVAAVSKAIEKDKKLANELTLKGRTIAVVSDGSAVLGLRNIGPEAAMPVMEGKAVLFKQFGGLDAFPICVGTQNTGEIISFVKNLAPTFAGINLEDIEAPRCFVIEQALQDIGIPVMHDDQHGTAIVVLAGLMNAAKVVGKHIKDLKIVVNGAGAAGIAIANMLLCRSFQEGICESVSNLVIVDSKGIIHKDRPDLNPYKLELAKHSNRDNQQGDLREALKGADAFVGVSRGNLLTADDIKLMNKHAIVFAIANPTPEIMPLEAKNGEALVVASGRSDFPNQINNCLVFPGIFK